MACWAKVKQPHALEPAVLPMPCWVSDRIPLSRPQWRHWFCAAHHDLLFAAFDGDGKPLSGRVDDYTRRSDVMRTSAQGQGAIEGKVSDYRVRPFGTVWRFSRFNSVAAEPRNVSRLRLSSSRHALRFCPNLNLQGGDIAAVQRHIAPTAADCYRACERQRGCSAFTHITAPGNARPCWLKTLAATMPQRGVRGTVSGVVGGAARQVGLCAVNGTVSVR